MKRTITFLMVILITAGSMVKAQIEKGNWFVNGLNILSFQTGSLKTDETDSEFNSKSNFTSFAIGPFSSLPSLTNAPSLNYGITDQLSGGILLNLILESEKNGDKITTSGFIAGPAIRYYLLSQKKFIPFAEGRLGIGSTNYDFGSLTDAERKTNVFGWHLGAGATYFFTPGVGLDFTLGYENIQDKEKESDSKMTYRYIQIGMGVLFVF